MIMQQENISSSDNLYVLGIHLENDAYAIKVGSTNNIMERLSNDAGYSILHTFHSKDAANIAKDVKNIFQSEEYPTYWYSPEYLNVILNLIESRL